MLEALRELLLSYPLHEKRVFTTADIQWILNDIEEGVLTVHFDRDGQTRAAEIELWKGWRVTDPLHVAWDAARKLCIIADAYNHKLHTFDPATGRVGTLSGDGEPGLQDTPPRFYEPGGCVVVGDRCFVADTNNHAIRVVDLKSGKVATLELKGLEPK